MFVISEKQLTNDGKNELLTPESTFDKSEMYTNSNLTIHYQHGWSSIIKGTILEIIVPALEMNFT